MTHSVMIHPDYEAGVVNDLALVKLANPVDFLANPNIRPIKLPTQELTKCLEVKVKVFARLLIIGQ